MLTRPDTGECLLPIGCSCISQFQLEFFAAAHPGEFNASGSFFRWNIITPEATARLLSELQINKNFSLFDSRDDVIFDAGVPCSRKIEGIYFWHIHRDVGARSRAELPAILDTDAAIAKLKLKYDHLLSKLRELPRETLFVWSNIQPNLQSTVAALNHLSWNDFILTSERMAAIRQSLRTLGFESTKCVWICRQDDCAVTEPSAEIRLMELPRSGEYKGQQGLFDVIYRSLLAAEIPDRRAQ